MRVFEKNGNSAKLELSLKELRLVCSALNEVNNGIEIREFETRLGVSIELASDLQTALGELIQLMEHDE